MPAAEVPAAGDPLLRQSLEKRSVQIQVEGPCAGAGFSPGSGKTGGFYRD